LVSRVLVDVSSMKIRRGNALSKKRLQRLIQCSRLAGYWGASVSLPVGVFFVTEAKPAKQTAHIRTVDRHAAPFQFQTEFIKRQIAVLLHALALKVGMPSKLAASGPMTLPARRERPRLRLQIHQIVHKTRRYPEMPGRRPVAVIFLHKRNNPASQLHRMRPAHRRSPFQPQGITISETAEYNPMG
jgi:hypothetical protein